MLAPWKKSYDQPQQHLLNYLLSLSCICFLWPIVLNIFSFSSVQSLSHVRLFVTPWTAACQASQQAGWQYTALMYSFSYLEPVCCSMSSCNCCFLTCIQASQEAGQVVWYSHLFRNFPQFIVIHINSVLTTRKQNIYFCLNSTLNLNLTPFKEITTSVSHFPIYQSIHWFVFSSLPSFFQAREVVTKLDF